MTAMMRLNFMVPIGMLAVAFVWGRQMGFAMPPLAVFTEVIALTVGFGALAAFYTRVRPDPWIARTVLSLVVYAIGSTAFRLWVYLVPTTNRPLIDATLAAADQALGFDWMALLAFYEGHPAVAAASTFLYLSSQKAMLVVAVVLVVLKRLDRLEAMIAASSIAGLFTLIVSAAYPAAGGFVHYDPPGQLFPSINPATARDFMDTFHQLRDGTLRTFELHETKGIITFPSFHTIFALLLIWAVRGIRWVFIPSLLWNGGIVLTTFIDGGHYLVDVLAGAVVAYATIRIVDWYALRHGEGEARRAPVRPTGALRDEPLVWIRWRA